MTQIKIEPERILVNFLRAALTDVNGSRSGQWIYDDFPRIESLGDASFPRISVTKLTESGESMGIFDDTQYENITFQIDVWAKKDHLHTVTVTDEALGTMSASANSNRMVYNYVPTTVTNIKHDGTLYGTVTRQVTDDSFTTPGSLSVDEVEWSFSTGNLNFSATDVSGDDGEAITSTYTYVLEGEKCVKHISRELIKAIRNNWRTHASLKGLFYPLKISSNSGGYMEEYGVYRWIIEYQFRAFNAGEGL
jgi:hypothetical protein|tara:strand:- start:21238 stop:21987 length:750 start_codon:yes stop_codon:yes gene_type:complete